MKILVVDDSTFIRKLIFQELEPDQHQIVEAASGEEALEMLENESFDLITLDIEMPGKSGFTVCQEFRQKEALTKSDSLATPILFVTGDDTIEGRMNGFESGATDFFVKPFDKGDLRKAVQKVFAPDPTFEGKKVLVVDDSPLICQILSTALKTVGIDTLTANNGVAGLKILKAEVANIDLVITDYEMPEMNGDVFCGHIRKTLGLDQLPVIFLTGASVTEYILKMFAAGASDLINKPFSQEELIARVHVHLREQRLKQKLRQKIEQLREAQGKLELMAVTDGLTGLFNHKYIFEQLETRLEEAKRYNQPLSILLLDIDHFKSVNDRFGHQRGDEVLVEVSQAIKNGVRDIDIASRYGGEEFLIVFPNTGIDGASVVAEKIRKAVEGLVWEDEGLHTAISGGLESYTGQTGLQLVEAADQKLYRAKNEGRNRII